MAKVPLVDVGNLANAAAARAAINENFDRIEAGFDNTLSRDGDLPNQMEADLDMNSNWVLNVMDPIRALDAVNLRSVEEIVANIINENDPSGTTAVTPSVYKFEGDGTTTEFPIPGAGIANTAFYEVGLESGASTDLFYTLDPSSDYSINLDPDDLPSTTIEFVTAPPNGYEVFVVLRGYARPYAGNPIDTVAPNIINITTNTIIDGSYQNALIVIDEPTNVTLTVRANTGDPLLDWEQGEGFAVLQKGVGKVLIAAEVGATVTPPTGFSNETRAQWSTIGVTMEDDFSESWVTSGDVLRTASTPVKQVIRLTDRSVLYGTIPAVGTSKDSYRMPFGFQLDSIADGGVRLNVGTAQASGSLFAVDVNVNGTSIFSTVLTLDNTETTSLTASTPAVYSVAFGTTANRIIAAGDVVTFDIDVIGAATAARGVEVQLVGVRLS